MCHPSHHDPSLCCLWACASVVGPVAPWGGEPAGGLSLPRNQRSLSALSALSALRASLPVPAGVTMMRRRRRRRQRADEPQHHSPPVLQWLQVLLTLFSEFFASFDHSTCALSVPGRYASLQRIHVALQTAVPSRSTPGRGRSHRPAPLSPRWTTGCGWVVTRLAQHTHTHNAALLALSLSLSVWDYHTTHLWLWRRRKREVMMGCMGDVSPLRWPRSRALPVCQTVSPTGRSQPTQRAHSTTATTEQRC